MQIPSRRVECGAHLAQVAELVDALGSGPSGGNTVEVRVLSWAPRFQSEKPARQCGLFVFPEPVNPSAGQSSDAARSNCDLTIASKQWISCVDADRSLSFSSNDKMALNPALIRSSDSAVPAGTMFSTSVV
ncbi:hypothetical protein CO2235_U670030 [Cupriavidus oxalaticus]|uniref:Uncharacterized protein n=1 Tax=Cupriavidus oxalaticus TaxID=96344 RepID=A0A375FQ34_9BURK|nr:hypothetical protein CO2235_U670030 [Cupriavidus oxalaticus]